MTWLNETDCNNLRLALRTSPSLYLAVSIDGKILWANPAFCEWSRYSLNELRRLTWMELSVKDDSDSTNWLDGLDEYNLIYNVQRKCTPKNDRPQLGNLHIMRVPASGEIQFCFFRWEPLVNGTAQAFELAIEAQKKVAEKMSEISNRIDVLASHTEEQKFTLSLVSMIMKYPKTAHALAILILSLGGFHTVLSMLQKLGYIQSPPVVVKEGGSK